MGISFLSGNTLKIIAALSMLIDHIGVIFFPGVTILRIIGRIAFPIFAFMIAEGCKYTRRKLRYFLGIFILAAICQTVYYISDQSTYMCVLVTFSFSILNIYALGYFKKCLFTDSSPLFKFVAALPFAVILCLTYVLNLFMRIDYGFFGCMLPVFASLPHMPENAPEALKKCDTTATRLLTLGFGALLLALNSGAIQLYSLFAIPILLLYSGKRGKYRMKYFFYIFYPLHLAVLQCIAWIIQ